MPIILTEVRIMRKITAAIFGAAMILTLIISGFIRDGRRLDELRGSVLRLHILADSDSERDQQLKLAVRDALLEHSSELFTDCGSLEETERAAAEKLPEIVDIAEETLRSRGCTDGVTAELADVYFDERTYGDITMPEGTYRALRVKIGSAQGHNWWCVMYPPLCIPAACGAVTDDEDTEKAFFDSEERDILYHPKRYRIKFALWDKIKELAD